MEASSDSKLEIGGYTDHQRFNGERHMARILKIICGFLDGGEGVGKVWVGFGVALVFLEIFLEREKAHFNILRRLRCAPGLFCAMDWSVDPLVHQYVNSRCWVRFT